MDLVFAPSQIKSWPIDRLRPYARNAKIHGTDQVAKIAASMAKFGWTVPCMVADDGELIAGHGRVLAAAMLGLKDVPVIRLSHLDEAERRAYRIADNKLTELGEWDEAMLRDEIAGLLAEDFDLSLLGITDEDLDALLRDPDQVQGGAVEGEDDIPEPPVTPVSVAGERPSVHCAANGSFEPNATHAALIMNESFREIAQELAIVMVSYNVEHWNAYWSTAPSRQGTKRLSP
jgi:hypothetical protein